METPKRTGPPCSTQCPGSPSPSEDVRYPRNLLTPEEMPLHHPTMATVTGAERQRTALSVSEHSGDGKHFYQFDTL